MPRRGPSVEVTAEWKELVDKRLRDLKMNRSDLARKIGVSRTAVTDLLGKLPYSSLVRPVNEALWPPNGEPEISKETQRPMPPNHPALHLVVTEPVADPSDPGSPEFPGQRPSTRLSFRVDDHASIQDLLVVVMRLVVLWEQSNPARRAALARCVSDAMDGFSRSRQ